MSMRRGLHGSRGVALLIVLLVTALLIALIFEFAYGTRVSLRGAVNFRDSQRAYFLARLGVTAFTKYGSELRKTIPQGQWQPLPPMGESDTEVSVKWEDESGKIKINDIKKDIGANGATPEVVGKLFENSGIDQAVVDGLSGQSDISSLTLLSGLHQYLSDENYNKVSKNLTVAPVSQNRVTINVNTASADVLQSLGISASDADRIIKERQATPYVPADLVSNGRISLIIGSRFLKGLNVTNYLTTDSAGYYTIYAYATVGGYTKQVEAIINSGSNATTYWRAW